MIATYNQLNKGKEETCVTLRNQIKEIDKKLERLEERLIIEEIDRAMFDKYLDKFNKEKKEIEKQLAESGIQVSNLEKCIDTTMTYASKLNAMWNAGDYNKKQRLQFLLFPEGMSYNRINDECRTKRVNTVFLYIFQLASILGEKKSGNNGCKTDVAALVESIGVEPTTSCMPCKRSSQLS